MNLEELPDSAQSNDEVAHMAAELAADRKASDITLLKIGEVSSVSDWFLVASGRSRVQVEAICDRISEGLRERFGRSPISTEGREHAAWAILDYGDLVVHVFQDEARKLYDLERLWSHAPRWNYEEGSAKDSS